MGFGLWALGFGLWGLSMGFLGSMAASVLGFRACGSRGRQFVALGFNASSGAVADPVGKPEQD